QRITFYLSSPHDIGVTLPLQEEPDQFPHASEILVFGCHQIETFDALAVIIYSDEGQPEEILWRSPWPDYLACPLSPPQ
ncbi:MAG: hypothetical protein KJ638_10440, partial [Chloroflexi bacterium]|nr:hypothetical protein [Chloroflexota bacterium]